MATHRVIGPFITAVASPGKYGVNTVAFSSSGSILATAGSDGTARLWNVVTHREYGPPITAVSHPRANGGVYGVAFNASGTILATGGGDGMVRLWNVASRA